VSKAIAGVIRSSNRQAPASKYSKVSLVCEMCIGFMSFFDSLEELVQPSLTGTAVTADEGCAQLYPTKTLVYPAIDSRDVGLVPGALLNN